MSDAVVFVMFEDLSMKHLFCSALSSSCIKFPSFPHMVYSDSQSNVYCEASENNTVERPLWGARHS